MADAVPPPAPEARGELRWLLEQVLLKITGRLWSTPRQTQLDAGRAISLLYDVPVRNGDYLASSLSALVRELGQRRPETRRYVGILENFIAELDLPAAAEPPPPGSATP